MQATYLIREAVERVTQLRQLAAGNMHDQCRPALERVVNRLGRDIGADQLSALIHQPCFEFIQQRGTLRLPDRQTLGLIQLPPCVRLVVVSKDFSFRGSDNNETEIFRSIY